LRHGKGKGKGKGKGTLKLQHAAAAAQTGGYDADMTDARVVVDGAWRRGTRAK